MRFNLILFVLVLKMRILWGTRDEYEDDEEVRTRRTVAQRAKAAHLTSDR
jgi:hypothetical protein